MDEPRGLGLPAPAGPGSFTHHGETLTPGVNVDRLDIAAGIDAGTELGYDSATDEMVTQYSLNLWARGDEDAAERNWLHYHPRDLTSWRVIVATAIARAQKP